MENKCPFCDAEEMRSRLILETDSFYVVPTKGQITEGYVLIISKQHATCFGDLSEEVLDEAERMMRRVRRMITDTYGQAPIFFEHGIVGQTVKHAHMHAMPCAPELQWRIAQDFREYEPVMLLQGLRETYRREGVYLFLEDQKRQRTLFHIFRTPMDLRILLAEALQVPERANWRTMDPKLDEQMMKDTVTKLRRQV